MSDFMRPYGLSQRHYGALRSANVIVEHADAPWHYACGKKEHDHEGQSGRAKIWAQP